MRNNNYATHCSLLTTHGYLTTLTTHHSPLTTHHSPLTTHTTQSKQSKHYPLTRSLKCSRCAPHKDEGLEATKVYMAGSALSSCRRLPLTP
eukprot:scaffold61427_cov70-Phaeocystis_antarctica.AAC.7